MNHWLAAWLLAWLVLIFAIVAGVIGFLLSFAIRLELQNPGIQIFPTIASWLSGDSSIDAAKNLYNVFITGHGVIMARRVDSA